MPLYLSEHGDAIERSYSDFIESRLPGYIKIWESYIGHDGKGNYLEINNIGQDEKDRRNLFVQYHYTCLESIVSMNEIIGEMKHLRKVSLSDAEGIRSYIGCFNLFIAFYAHSGRIKDLVEKMALSWGQKDLGKDFNEFYQQRNNVLHESKLPVAFIAEAIAILPPEGEEEDKKKWGGERIWANANEDDFEFINEYLTRFFEEILNRLNSFLQALFAKSIASFSKEHPLILPDCGDRCTQTPTLSGRIYKIT